MNCTAIGYHCAHTHTQAPPDNRTLCHLHVKLDDLGAGTENAIKALDGVLSAPGAQRGEQGCEMRRKNGPKTEEKKTPLDHQRANTIA